MNYDEQLFQSIGLGKEHGIERPSRRNVDRRLRRRINEANKKGDLIIPLETGGYYRPDFSRPEERAAAHVYMRVEAARIKDLIIKAGAMMDTIKQKETAL